MLPLISTRCGERHALRDDARDDLQQHPEGGRPFKGDAPHRNHEDLDRSCFSRPSSIFAQDLRASRKTRDRRDYKNPIRGSDRPRNDAERSQNRDIRARGRRRGVLRHRHGTIGGESPSQHMARNRGSLRRMDPPTAARVVRDEGSRLCRSCRAPCYTWAAETPAEARPMKIDSTTLGIAALGIGAVYLYRQRTAEPEPFDPETATEEELRESVLGAARAQQASMTPDKFPARTQQSAPQVLEAAGLEDSAITFSIWRRSFETSDGPAEGYRMQVGGPGTDGQVTIRTADGAMLSPAESAAGGSPLAFYPQLDQALEALTAYVSIFQNELIQGA